MAKFVLPLLVFACAGFSQGKGAPKIDPKTGLPVGGGGKSPKEEQAEKLAVILKGAG